MTPLFELKLSPFKVTSQTEVSASLEKTSRELFITYKIIGDDKLLKTLPVLKPVHARKRKDKLWEENCFEFFWTSQGQKYFEVNVAPTGDWQLYSFDSYRSRTKDLISSPEVLALNVKNGKGCYELTLRISPIEEVTQFNVCVVFKESFGLDYYALNHAPDRADFHDQSVWKSWEK